MSLNLAKFSRVIALLASDREGDPGKFARVTALLASDHEGERANAAGFATRMLKAAGLGWQDLVEACHQAEIAAQAAAVLLDENTALRAELEQLRSEQQQGTAVALWNDIGAQANIPADTRTAARWALDLHRRGVVWLSPDFEIAFLTRCTSWRGRLTPKMQPIFQRIMDRVVTRTGMTPPSS